MITLKARGNFRLTGDGGEDITPSSMKARGVIALLALAPDHLRRRAWLQDKLWSESDHKHGADSLRQTLTLVRRALGMQAHALQTNRRTVSLDSACFRVDYQVPSAVAGSDTDGELFANLDVPDPEFESWIRDMRSEFTQRPDQAGRPTNPVFHSDEPAIVFYAHSDAAPDDELIQTAISLATASLLDIADFTIFHDRGLAGKNDSATLPSHGVHVSVSVMPHIAPPELRVAVCNLQTGRVLSQSHFPLNRREFGFDTADIYRASVGLVEVILTTLKSWQGDLQIKECSALLVNRARHLLFRFDKPSLATADRYLLRAYQFEAKPQYLAWRALVRSMAE
ncbi:MAG: hypothetical protein RID59_05445, partial [Hoeflea sp.]